MEICTIGFTKKSAREFFETLRNNQINRLIDIRLNNTSQLAGYAKKEDLQFFLREICGIEYVHETLLAPTEEILDNFKKKKISWTEYEKQFVALLERRNVRQVLDRSLFSVPTVLLCSEPSPDYCHRRLAAEYLMKEYGNGEINHL